jgi:hypothetical protein
VFVARLATTAPIDLDLEHSDDCDGHNYDRKRPPQQPALAKSEGMNYLTQLNE